MWKKDNFQQWATVSCGCSYLERGKISQTSANSNIGQMGLQVGGRKQCEGVDWVLG